MEAEDVETMVAEVDTDGDGVIDFDEFCQLLGQEGAPTVRAEEDWTWR